MLNDEAEREYLDWVEKTYRVSPEYWEGVKREARLLRGNQRTLCHMEVEHRVIWICIACCSSCSLYHLALL